MVVTQPQVGRLSSPATVCDNLTRFAIDYNAAAAEKVDYFVFGHLHVLVEKALPDGAKMVVLGDWISKFSYAVWDGESLKIDTFTIKIDTKLLF